MKKFWIACMTIVLGCQSLTTSEAGPRYPVSPVSRRPAAFRWQYFDTTSPDGVREHLARIMSPTIIHTDGHTITARLALTTREHRISVEIDFFDENGLWSLPTRPCPDNHCTVTTTLDDQPPVTQTGMLAKQMGMSIFLPKPNEFVVALTKASSMTFTTDTISEDGSSFTFDVDGLVWPGVNQ